MENTDHVYVDETYWQYSRNKINFAAVGIGYLHYSSGSNGIGQPQLLLHDWVGIAKRGKIKAKDLDVLGMLTSDKLVDVTQLRSVPKYYHMCAEIEKYTAPYLKNHAERLDTKKNRKIRRLISQRIDKTDCNAYVRGNYKRKQSIGNMAKEEVKGITIPDILVQEIGELNILDIKKMEVLYPAKI